MQKLADGVHAFQRDIFPGKEELFAQLSKGQNPETLFITCSDSRVVPSFVTNAQPGDLFELQNAGNIVPSFGASDSGGEAATIEYAVAALRVKDIVVCGHSQCGAMTGILEPDKLQGLPAVQGWLKHAETTRRIMQENYKHLTEFDKRLTATVEENVLVQLEHLRTHPAVAVALARGALHLHGWVFKIETGEVFAYDPDANEFLPLAKTAAKTPAKPKVRGT